MKQFNNLTIKQLFAPRGIASMAEIVLVGGIFLLLMSLGVFSLNRFQSSSSLTTVVDTFIADFKNQQIKAMQGDTESGSAPDNYGIHFDSTSYTLFKGTYDVNDLNNFKVTLPPSINVYQTYVDNVLYFTKGEGRIASYNEINNIKFTDNSGLEKTISISYWGATRVE